MILTESKKSLIITNLIRDKLALIKELNHKDVIINELESKLNKVEE